MNRQKIIFVAHLLYLFIVTGLLSTTPTVMAAGRYLSDPPSPGRVLTMDDWAAHLSLLVAVTLFVIVVDGLVIGLIMRQRRRNKAAVQHS